MSDSKKAAKNEIQNFLRNCSGEDRKIYYEKKKLGTDEQRRFRQNWQSLLIKAGSVASHATHTTRDALKHVNKVRFLNPIQIAEAEGALVDREYGMSRMRNIIEPGC